MIDKYFKNIDLFLFIFLILSIMFVYILEYFFDIKPCELCLYQRYIYFFLIVFFVFRKNLSDKVSNIIISFSLFSGCILSFYHVGVEKEFWNFVSSCSVIIDNNFGIKEQILNSSFVPCNIVQWKIFNLSLSEWNFIFSFKFLLIYLYKVTKK